MYTKTILDYFIDWLTEYKQLEPDEVKGIYYPNKKQIISLHDYLINNFKYKGELVNNGLQTDGVLDFTGLKYYEDRLENKLEDIVYRGARIFNSFLEEGHPFNDGNKRTGFVTLWIFLIINNHNVIFKFLNYGEHVEKFRKWAMSSNDNIYEITMWIKENEAFKQKIKRRIINLIIKIKKLISR